MEHWAKRESRLFGPLGRGDQSSHLQTRRRYDKQTRFQRGAAVQMLRQLVSRHDYLTGPSAALNLLDTLGMMQVEPGSGCSIADHLQTAVGLPALLGAVARVALKNGGAVSFFLDEVLTDNE